MVRGNRILSYAPSSPRAAGAKEGETAGFGRTERPRDEGFERVYVIATGAGPP